MTKEETESLSGSAMPHNQSKCTKYLKDNLLMILNILAIVIGFAIGFGIRDLHPSPDALMWIGLPGELFLRMLKMLILPLIVSTVISGSASLDPKSNGKISVVAFIYIMITHVLACSLAVLLTAFIKPGIGNIRTNDEYGDSLIQTQDIFADLLRNVFPNNMIEATFKQAQTQYVKDKEVVVTNTSEGMMNITLYRINKINGTTGGTNVLGLIAICSIIGIALSKVKEKATVFLQFFVGASEVILVILRCFFWVGPIGIASLIAVSIASVANITEVFSQLGLFVAVVIAGIFIFQFVILSAIFFIITRSNPYKYMLSAIRAMLLGFASTSTAVAIPEMMMICDHNKIDKRVSRFVIPFCVTLNADGSVLYITSAVVFIIQLTTGTLTTSQVLIVIVLTSICGTAIPSVPSASIVTIVIVLTSIGVGVKQVAILIAVEWILDRVRTQCNVASHTMCAAITYRLCRQSLKQVNLHELTNIYVD